MIIFNTITTPGFLVCLTYLSPNEYSVYHNVGNGHYHDAVYAVSGSARVVTRESMDSEPFEDKAPVPPGTFVNLEVTRGCFTETYAGPDGLSIILFNPLPAEKSIRVSKLDHGTQSVQLNPEDSRATIVCITGDIQVNDKTLTRQQYAKILNQNPVTIAVPESGLAFLVRE